MDLALNLIIAGFYILNLIKRSLQAQKAWRLLFSKRSRF
ncbi:hypothetical protein UNSW3_321 [Campylobacter concisus UNSW3]|uniref:Uncharacterized protein n=1 Tax=Campylobacter concisus UNSW3 TaxID=1242966 RepID=U2G2M6_9BACT|nr:hypothetical protein UNSW3_321 [Campylobacter concisus UNSW3]